MARLSDEQKEQFVADWKTGHWSQNQLAKNYNVSPATANKLCKGVEQNNAEIVNTQTRINTELADKNEYEVNSIHNAVSEKTRRANLVYGTAERLVKKIDNTISNGKRLEKVNAGDGVQQLIPVDFNASDLKNFADAIDRTAVTLEVAPRHSNGAQVAIQNNNKQFLSESEVMKVVADALPD